MMTTLVSLYFKLNIILLFSFLIWFTVGKFSQTLRIPLSSNLTLALARYYFIAALTLPILLIVLVESVFSQPAIPVLSVIGQTLSANIDNGLNKTIAVGSQSISFTAITLTMFVSGLVVQLCIISHRFLHLKSVLIASTQWKHQHNTWIVFSHNISTPFSTQALGRNQIVLPYQLLESPKYLRLAVKHELQHIRNGDLRWVLFLEILRAVFFWNPAFFIWQNEFHCLQEYACDEALLSKDNVEIDSYGNCLLEVASHISHKSLLASSNMIPNFGFLKPTHSQLKKRIQMLNKKPDKQHTYLKSAAYSCLLILGLAGCSTAVMNASKNTQIAERKPYLPITTRAPHYSEAAITDGITGWVHVEFDVDRNGSTQQAEVVDHCTVKFPYDPDLALSETGCMINSDIFDQAAIDAINDFKFNPRVENGETITTSGVQYLFRFALDKEGNNEFSNSPQTYSSLLEQYKAKPAVRR